MDRPHSDLVLEKDLSPKIDAHGTIVLNWILSELIYGMIFFLLSFIVIGWPLLILLAGLSFVYPLIGAAKASQGDIWNYPWIPQHHQASSPDGRMNHSVYENTKKETWGILLLWACFALWVMIPCYLLGYQQAPEETLKMVLGFPSWVFWGIALPWLGSNLAIILFVLFRYGRGSPRCP